LKYFFVWELGASVRGCGRTEPEEEILQIAAQHAVKSHRMTVDDGLVAAVKAAIRDEEAG
jgi:predicted small metal-binding protein